MGAAPALARTLSLACLLALAAAACQPDAWFFEFEKPRDGQLVTGGAAAFDLKLSPLADPARLQIWLDDAPLDASSWVRHGARVHGTLAGLAPGPHELRAVLALGASDDLSLSASVAFESAAAARFRVRESVEQLQVTHADPGMPLELRNRRGRRIASGVADAQGSLMFREIPPGDGYVVRAKPPLHEAVGPLTVMSIEGSTPPPEFYRSQHLEPGFGYIETRDGTRLSVFVSLPGPVEDGPYPTLVNYSGYDPSEPGKPLDFPGIDISFLCGDLPVLCDAPNHPSGLIAGVLGFATVGVNLRGTGCSGGAYDFFEPLQLLDGYDVIETVAAQDWALNHRVGMAGLSYPGITQLFVASTRPPSLAAITPLSVIDATPSVLAPGGILNDGFALEWGQEVLERAAPYGRGWEQGVVDAGDTTCEENQLLHSQKVDIIEKALSYPFYVPEIYDPVDPITLVDRIDVPVFTAGAWQDEQVGGHFPALWNRFTNAPVVRFTGYNGAHADGYTPQILAEWKNFLDFYVAGEIRPISPLVRSISPFLFESVFGAFVQIPEERFADFPSFDAARTTYEAEPPVRIILESGGSPDEEPGAPVGGFELSFPSWPPPNTEPRRWYFHADGSLRDFPPAEPVAASTFQADPEKGQETYEVHDAFEQALPDIEWLPWKPGRQVVFVSEPLLEDVVMVGHASADLWIQATADDADLEVMLSEVRPDGMETYVQSGWLRASQRALSPESTPLRPIQTHREADAAPLPPGEWTSARVEIYPFAHVFRAGSRLRVSVSTPGGNQGRWRYDVLPTHATVAVSHSAAHPSSVLLPVIPDVEVPTPLPPCPSLRSQPCREYVPQLNARLE